MDNISVLNFFEQLKDFNNITFISKININNIDIDIKFVRKKPDNKTIVVYFQGALPLNKIKSKEHPIFFEPKINENLLIISDPFYKDVMNISEVLLLNLSISSWYTPLQNSLEELLKETQNEFKFEKFIFIGGSSGGFAALYNSYFIDNSICITFNPQINIVNYLTKLKNTCQTKLDDIINKMIETKQMDLISLYQNGSTNNIIYVVNNMSLNDIHHSVPFMYKTVMSKLYKKNFIFKFDFWGKHGHRRSIPDNEYTLWIEASIMSKSCGVEDISDCYWRLKNNIIKDIETNDISDRIAKHNINENK